ncbi:MAG: oligosaccharide flippase family protein [Candidatus Marinimicrobia bacterium]|nr:oligosaccharide flippase family protein [Candidatus Neomarinimicrobiota bacterium]
MIEKIKNAIQIKFVGDSLLTTISHAFIGISGLIINTIVAIHYGANGLGIFSQGLSVYMLVSLFSTFGIHISTQKYASQYSNNPEQLRSILINSIIAVVMMSTVVMGTFYLFLEVFPLVSPSQEVYSFIKVICIAAPFFALNKTLNGFFVGVRSIKIYAAIRLLRWLFLVLGIIYFSIYHFKLENIGRLFITIEILLLFILIIFSKNYWGGFSWKWVKEHIAFGAKNILAGFIGDFGTRVPILIIGYIAGNEASGLFAYVLTFSKSILMIPQALQKNFNPVFTKNWYENKLDKISLNIHQIFKVCAYTVLPVMFLLYLFFIGYTTLLMPPKYLDQSLTLLLLLIGSGAVYLYGPFSTLLIMTGHLYTNLLRVLIFTGINVFFSYVLGLHYGIFGVAIAVSLSLVIDAFACDYFYKTKLNIKLFKLTIGQLFYSGKSKINGL